MLSLPSPSQSVPYKPIVKPTRSHLMSGPFQARGAPYGTPVAHDRCPRPAWAIFATDCAAKSIFVECACSASGLGKGKSQKATFCDRCHRAFVIVLTVVVLVLANIRAIKNRSTKGVIYVEDHLSAHLRNASEPVRLRGRCVASELEDHCTARSHYPSLSGA